MSRSASPWHVLRCDPMARPLARRLARPLGHSAARPPGMFPERASAQGSLLVCKHVPGAQLEGGRRILSLINIEVEGGRPIKI